MSDSIHVLHVDDEPNFAAMAAEFLEREDDRISVQTATNARDALDILAESEIDCIVSDHDMPGQNGIEFLETVRKEHPDLPFVLYTGKGSEAVASDAIGAGVTDYLQKGGGTEQYEILANEIVSAVQKHRTERELDDLRRRYTELVEQNFVGIYIIQHGEFVYVNPRLAEIHGYDEPAEIIGLSPLDLVAPEERERVQTNLERRLSGQKEEIQYQTIGRRKDGERIDIELHGSRIDYEGEPAIIGAELDVTERKEREAVLKEETEKYSTLIEQSHDGILVLQEGKIRFANGQAEDILGFEEAELVGKTLQEIVAPQDRDRVLKRYRRRLDPESESPPARYDLQFLTKGGEQRYANISAAKIQFEGKSADLVTFRDITERKKRALQLDTLISNLPGMVYRARNAPDWPMEFVRGDCESLTGYAAEDLEEGKVVFGEDVVHPADQQDVWEAVQNSIEEGRPFEITYRIRTKDGATKWVWERGQIVDSRASDGQHLEGFITDITERKEQKAELQQERTRRNALFQHTIDPVVFLEFVSGDPVVREVNTAFEETFGYEEASAVGRPIYELVVPDESETMQEAKELNRRIEAGELVETEVRRQAAEGFRDFLLQSIPLEPGESGTKAYAIYSDVTERKQRERKLERYERLVEASGDPMYMLDAEGCFRYVNGKLAEITGYSEAELLGEHFGMVTSEAHLERGTNLIQSLLSSGDQHGKFELEIQTKAGERVPVENHLGLLTAAEGIEGTVGVLRDITERLERERKLQRERDRLDRFASVVSHDLRNPLNVATGRLELAMEDPDRSHIEAATEALDRMETLIDDVLTLARAGDSVGEMKAVELAELGCRCWDNVETESARLSADSDAVIRADESRLQQLVENLFRNAIEHGDEDVRVSVGEIDGGFYVEDDGPGIPEAERDQVFEAGYSSREAGTGFGLSIVKEIVEAHDWAIRVTEGTEGGARFEITGVEFVAE
jgi:PAS domain S-box-containing protein